MESSRKSSNKGKNVVKKRTKQHTSNAIDYMSYVPVEVLHLILSLLPIRELIVMSLLSNGWKKLVVDFFSTIPQSLNLHEYEMTGSILRRDLPCLIHAAQRKFMDIVDRSFLLHSGCTIKSLNLCLSWNAYKRNGYSMKIDRWVHTALTTDIKELSLDFSNRKLLGAREFNQSYDMPDGCFAPKILKTLSLCFCKFRLSSFQIFESLQSISLVLVQIFDCSLAELLSKCPVLQDVNLENCIIANNFLQSEEDMMIKTLSIINCETYAWPPYSINLSTPYLLELTIVRPSFRTSHIRNATKLQKVYIAIQQLYANPVEGEALSSFLTDINHCQSLILNTWCIQVLPTRMDLRGELQSDLQYLKQLHLLAGFAKQELPGISCLLRSSPNLETLILHMQRPIDILWIDIEQNVADIFNFEEETYWQTQNSAISCLHFSLKKVTVTGFTGVTNEFKIIEFLLRTARNLERMDVFTEAGTKMKSSNAQQRNMIVSFQCNLYLMLSSFPKASPRARIALA